MKDLKTEYKKAALEETPDLWNRIEVSLPEKTVKKPKKKISVIRYASLAAAGLFMALIIPGSIYLMQNGESKSDSAYEMMDSDIQYNSLQTAEDGATDKGYLWEIGENTGSATGSDSMEGADYEADSAPEMNSTSEKDEEFELGNADSSPADEKDDSDEMADEKRLEKTMKVTRKRTLEDGVYVYYLTEAGVDYKCLASKGFLDSDVELKKGESYTFIVEHCEEEGFTYRIIGVK